MGFSIAVQNDGKIIQGGTGSSTSGDFELVRYNINGTLDASFGSEGKVITNISSDNDKIFSIAIQNDGKIVAGGVSGTSSALSRYNTNGTLDNTFGTGGIVTTSTTGNDYINSIAIQSDGKILTAGNRFIVSRYNTDGTLDNTFGNNGTVQNYPSNVFFQWILRSIVIQPDGKIVTGGDYLHGTASANSTNIALLRYNTDGTMDNSFGDNGIKDAAIGIFNMVSVLAIQNDGKILAGGSVNAAGDFMMLRFNGDGNFDNTFDNDGISIVSLSPGSDHITSISIQDNGMIIAGGVYSNSNHDDIALVRYYSNGTRDASFGEGGIIKPLIPNTASTTATSIKLTGVKLYVGGWASYSTSTDAFILLNYLVDTTIPLILPVGLINFYASTNNGFVTLNWSTSFEQNVNFFEIEKSGSGNNYTDIHRVSAIGNSSSITTYSFNDNARLNSIVYYRLKIIDNDNRFKYSNVIIVKPDNNLIHLTVFPNPAHDFINIHFKSGTAGVNKIIIQDIAGRLIKTLQLHSLNGLTATSVDIRNLNPGIYILRVGNENIRFVKK